MSYCYSNYEGTMFHWTFWCSNCGIKVPNKLGTYFPEPVQFCPKCGFKVVSVE